MINAETYAMTIRSLGIAMLFTQVKTGTTRNIPKGGIASPKQDTQIVNAYGVGARVITLLAADMGGIEPVKFDTITINGSERLALDHVLPVHEPGTGTIIGWRCIVKGK